MTRTDENRKLNELLENSSSTHHKFAQVRAGYGSDSPVAAEGVPSTSDDEKDLAGLVQWTTADGKRFVPASHTADKLTPGVYEIQHSNTIGIYFERIPVLTLGLLRFPQTNSERVLEEIQKFWEKAAIFKEY